MWYTNKAVWGSIFMLAAIVASLFGVQITEGEQGQLVDSTVAVIEAAIGLFGLVMMIVDRVQALYKIRRLEGRIRTLERR